ncbi:Arc family DNA-binding protein [Citreimonas sp.]|uniref:Arc family DNA-binding protein n=1 Tax=Citreimonas sp. TaxID=3036715 RepID=UPI0040593A53
MADESKYPTRIAPYGLRMPPDLKSRVQASADANNRTLHSEIIAALEEKYPSRPTTAELIAKMEELLELQAATPVPHNPETQQAARDLIYQLRQLMGETPSPDDAENDK